MKGMGGYPMFEALVAKMRIALPSAGSEADLSLAG
jgi:hypothetical protein